MNDLTLAIKLTTEGGQVVVKDLSTIVQSSNKAADALGSIGTAGTAAGRGLENTSGSSEVLEKNLKDQNQALQKVLADLQRTAAASLGAGRGFDTAALGSKSLSNSLKQNDADLSHVRNNMLTLVGVSAALYAGMAAFSQVRGLAQQADDFNVLQQRIKTATKDTGDYNLVSAEMYAIAQENGAALAPTVELFQRLSSSRKDLKATNEQMLDFTDTVQKLGVIGGSSTQAMENGLMQLSQGLSGGVLRAEEFNSILENIPELAVRIGKGMDDIGKSDNELGLGDLRKLVLEGKLLSDDVLKSILSQLPEISKEFADMPVSMGRASVMVDNAISAALARLDEASGVTTVWADTLVSISETLDDMDATELNNSVAALLAIAGGGAALMILSKYGIGLASVGAGYQALTAWISSYRTVQVATTATVYNAATMTNLTVASNMAAARSFNILSASAGAARGALALIGGPVGLAALAAWGIYEFANSSTEAEEKAELMAKALGDVGTGFDEVSKKNAAAKITENLGKLSTVNADLASLESKLASTKRQMDALGTPRSETQWRQYDLGVQKLSVLENKIKATKQQQQILIDANNQLELVANPVKPSGDDNKTKADALNESLLKLYNTQMLNAQAIDAQGRALNGVDLELFKAKFTEATKLPADAEAAIRSWMKSAEAAAQLATNDKYLVGLTEEVRLQQIRLQLGEQEYELAKAISSQKITDPKQLATLKQQLALQQQISQVKTEDDALKALEQENDLLQIRLDKGEAEYELQKMVRQLKVTDPATIALLDLEIDRQRQLNEQLDVRKYLTDGTYDDVLDGLTQIGDMGGAAGNALVDAFGSVADQFANMAEQQDEFTKKFIILSEARKKAEKETNPALRTKALEKADAVERSLMEDQLRMQIGGYATLTSAASKMFSENSKGRQVLHRMETTFAAIETALALKKAAANALTAITNQGGGDPYSAFARIAAMAALMAGLGVFSGSTSSGTSATSRQESQGTGTILGDSSAKSNSIANSLERIESLELDQYSELRSINASIRSLNAGIAKLAVNLVASYGRFDEGNYQGELGKDYKVQLGSTAGALVLGGVIGAAVDNMLGGLLSGITNKVLGGLFGSTKKELVDSGISFAAQELGDILATGLVDATLYDVIKTTKKKAFGLSKSTRENTEYRTLDEEIRAEFGRVFSYIGNSVTEAVKLLGLTTTKDLENFVIKLPNVSFKNLSGDEIEKELQAIFSQQGDLMAKYLVPGIAEFQQMGEGLYDTLIRVAQEQAVFNAGLASLGLELSRFGNVSKQAQIEIAQSLIELMGGIEEFSSATSDYFAAFYSESEQMAYMQKVINEQFKSLGVTVPKSRDGFKDLVDGLDLTTEAGQAMFAALMKLVPMMDEFYDAAEDAADAAKKAADEEKKLAAERSKYNASVRSDIARMGMSPLQIALDDINKWYTDAKKEAEALGADTSLLTVLYNKKREALATEYVSKSIESAEAAMTALVADYQRSVEQLGQTLASVLDSIAGMSDTIRGDILNIRKTLPEFDSVAYYSGEVASLSDQLGTGTATAQLDIIGKLKAAMLERYNAELAAIGTNMSALQAEQDAKQELYETQLEQFESLKEAALSLKNAAASLLYSDLSTLTAGERLQQLQSQYNTAVTKARGGDAQAYAQVQSLGEQLLQMSKDYDPAAYNSVFDSVLDVFNELGNKTFAAPTAPAPHPAVAAFEAEKTALARKTIEQLEELTSKTVALNEVANTEYTAAVNALKTQFSVDANKITMTLQSELASVRAVMPKETDRVVKKLQDQIDAIYNMRDGIVGAIKVIPAPVVPKPAPIDLTPIVEPIRQLPPKLDRIWEPLPILPPYLRDIQTSVRDVSRDQIFTLQKLEDKLHLNNASLATIAKADFVAKPLIIPPAQVAVNVDMVSVVAELRLIQRQQQNQLDQQAVIAQQTNQKLTDVVDSNKRLQTELSEFSSQAINLARVS
jgi:tape measure domain-containing protein